MEILILLIFVSLMLVLMAVGFFLWNVLQANHHHVDRLALMALEEERSSHVDPGVQ